MRRTKHILIGVIASLTLGSALQANPLSTGLDTPFDEKNLIIAGEGQGKVVAPLLLAGEGQGKVVLPQALLMTAVFTAGG